MSMRAWLTVLCVLCAMCAACGDDDGAGAKSDAGKDGGRAGGALAACDPFAPHMLPITLAKLLGAGQDSKGTIYAADDGGVEGRVFVSSGTQLVRQRIAGSGGETSGSNPKDMLYGFGVKDHDPPFALEIEGVYPDSARMGVLIGDMPTDRKTFTIGQDGEELTIVAETKVKALKLRNLPGDVA